MRFCCVLEKVRFYEPTRFENQLYEQILKRIATFRAKIIDKNGIGRLDSLLQKNVRLIKPVVIEDQINTELEYRTLKRTYGNLQNTGFPSSKLSGESISIKKKHQSTLSLILSIDYCLLHISSLDNCNGIEKQCLQVISSNAPTYGYRRMHQ